MNRIIIMSCILLVISCGGVKNQIGDIDKYQSSEISTTEEIGKEDVVEQEFEQGEDTKEVSMSDHTETMDMMESIEKKQPYAILCKIGCKDDKDCEEGGGKCVTFENLNQTFCTIPCSSGCPDGFFCTKLGQDFLCIPLSGDCNNAFKGIDCNNDILAGICKNEDPICSSSDANLGYCTRACETDQDCPKAFRRCVKEEGAVKGICRAYWEKGPEGCGRGLPDANGFGGPCVSDKDCKIGICIDPPPPTDPIKYCLVSGDSCEKDSDCIKDSQATAACLTAPSFISANKFCTKECQKDDDCGVGAQCLPYKGGKYCLSSSCACLSEEDTMHRKVLDAIGLHPCNAIFPRLFLKVWQPSIAHDPFRLSRFYDIHHYPRNAIYEVEKDLMEFDGAKGLFRVLNAIKHGARLLDKPIDAEGNLEKSDDLSSALKRFILAGDGTPDLDKIEKEIENLPPKLSDKLVLILDAMTNVAKARKMVSEKLGDKALEGLFFDYGHGFLIIPKSMVSLSAKNKYVQEALLGKLDLKLLYDAGYKLAEAIAKTDFGAGSYGDFFIRIDTPLGAIIISGDKDDIYTEEKVGGAIALLLDTGGDDTYLVSVGANVSLSNPVSLLIDLSGDDKYGYEEKGEPIHPLLLPEDEDGRYKPSNTPDKDNGPISLSDTNRQGAGRLGVGMLFDFEGNDSYQSLRISQGCGLFGVGVLYDGGGNDIYKAESASQGAGIFGIGILVDEGGDDSYSGFHCIQGFGYVSGFGLLYDIGGNDEYIAHLGDKDMGGFPLYYNPQNPGKSNTSMAQGFGFGRRADMTDKVFMSGGFGILRDLGGSDKYISDIFGQGAGYWFGTGVLADKEGNDQYKGRWYVQGAGAHFAVGILLDEAGDDIHNQDIDMLNASLGLGHDFSLGIFADFAGNDTYFSPSLSVGAGNDNGIGMFLDFEGDDKYDTKAINTFGWASNSDFGSQSPRNMFIALGLILDAKGKDLYNRLDPDPVGIKDGAIWTMSLADPNQTPLEKGGGMDGEEKVW